MIIGIIGGGQLAKMLVDAANKKQMEVVVMTPYGSDPACRSTDRIIFRGEDDCKGIKYLSEHCDAITFENEFVDIDTLQKEVRFNYRPSLEALATCIDKYKQRQFLDSIAVPQPSYRMFNLREHAMLPCVLKATRFGYDGKGTFIIKNVDDLNKASEHLRNTGIIKEELVSFDKELAVMVARNIHGEITTFPVVESYQCDIHNICDYVVAHSNFSQHIVDQVNSIAKRIVSGLNYVGLMGIEMFLRGDEVLVNELAPRAHNSGHYSMDACHTSQFDIQLQAINGDAFGDTSLKCDVGLMVNLLGYEYSYKTYEDRLAALANLPNTNVHWYQKMESRPLRKLGHVNMILPESDLQFIPDIVHKIKRTWNPGGL